MVCYWVVRVLGCQSFGLFCSQASNASHNEALISAKIKTCQEVRCAGAMALVCGVALAQYGRDTSKMQGGVIERAGLGLFMAGLATSTLAEVQLAKLKKMRRSEPRTAQASVVAIRQAEVEIV